MALDNIRKFKEAAAGDAALKEKVNSVLSKTAPEKHAELLSTLASEAGYTFTAEEYREAVMRAQSVSDDELDAVSGGTFNFKCAISDKYEGFNRDWLIDGCSATVEPGSHCWTDDYCSIWDTTYLHKPTRPCPQCGGMMYETENPKIEKCKNCGFIEKYLDPA